MTNAWRLAALVIATSLLASCGLFSDKDEDLEPKELVNFKQTLKIKRLWSAKAGGKSEFLRLALRPVGDGNRIYAASYDGFVSAFDPQSGKKIWRTKLDTPLAAGPGVGEGRVVVVSMDGFVFALDANSGAVQWRVNIGGESLARPAVKGELVILQTIDNRMRAFSIYDGQERWAFEQSTPTLTMRGSASPALIGNTVVGGFDNGRLVAANLLTGDIIWESLLSPPKGRSDLDRLSDIDGSLAVVGQDLYATGYQGRLAAIASESGQVLWSREISSYVGVSADWNSVYTAAADGEIIALSRRDGTETWRNNDLLRREPTLPVPFHTTVVVGDFEGYVHFFSNLTGTPVARIKLGGAAISSPPLVVANRLYVQGDSGAIAAYEVVEDRPKRQAPDVAVDES
ncbi:MAG: outer membrane protein assembly factor BamB [Gammaproteobacteria bacterium]|nr:outer membrane protein assembly factor BamB [Gammaproteobacteria bacterium]NNL51842.1 outer membrane protein assembly factor BamB [Woeseiaceae bacterium]